MSWGGNSQGSRWQQQNNLRPVVPGGAGGAMVPAPDLGASVNPISAKGGRLCPPYNTGTPGFSDLPTALINIKHWSTALIRERLDIYATFDQVQGVSLRN